MTSRATATATRARIIDRALLLVHQQGFQHTTLAEFADAAQIPTGNLYYYFKTKEALGELLIDTRLSEFRSLFDEFDKNPSPKQRLLALIAAKETGREELTKYGCPVGSLTQELAKQGGPLAAKAGALFDVLLDWVARQFDAMGQGQQASCLARQLISSLQGATVLASALRRPSILLEETQRLTTWIEGLSQR